MTCKKSLDYEYVIAIELTYQLVNNQKPQQSPTVFIL